MEWPHGSPCPVSSPPFRVTVTPRLPTRKRYVLGFEGLPVLEDVLDAVDQNNDLGRQTGYFIDLSEGGLAEVFKKEIRQGVVVWTAVVAYNVPIGKRRKGNVAETRH